MTSSDTVILGDDFVTARTAAQRFAAELEATLSGDGIELPSLPDVALKIRNALANPTVDVDHLAQLVGSDPVLAARLLKTANSALFHRGSKAVRDIRTAIMRLGFKMVRNISISLAAQQVFIGYGTKEIHAQVRKVWKHSVHVATLAYLVSTKTRNLSTEEAFLAGLLHEVGRLYLLMRARDHDDLIRNEIAFTSIADEWQARIGAGIARAWGFDEELVGAIADHESCNLIADGPITLTHVVAVANFLAASVQEAPDAEELLDDLPTFGAFELDKQTLAWMLAVSADEVHSLQAAFGA